MPKKYNTTGKYLFAKTLSGAKPKRSRYPKASINPLFTRPSEAAVTLFDLYGTQALEVIDGRRERARKASTREFYDRVEEHVHLLMIELEMEAPRIYETDCLRLRTDKVTWEDPD